MDFARPLLLILMTFLFIIHINDLSTINNTLKCIMSADDTTIYFNTEYLAKHITTDLDKVDVWLKHNKLSLNVEKLNDFSRLSGNELLQLSIDGKPTEHGKY